MNEKGFFGTLFDTDFRNFITPAFIKVLYIIGLIVIALGALGVVWAAYESGGVWGAIFGVFGGLAAALLWTIGLRIFAEVSIVAFRAWENTERLLADD